VGLSASGPTQLALALFADCLGDQAEAKLWGSGAFQLDPDDWLIETAASNLVAGIRWLQCN
jgi:hypothetical protein